MSSQTLEGDGIDYLYAGKRARESNRACSLPRAGEAGEAGGCIVAINETARKCGSTGLPLNLNQVITKRKSLFSHCVFLCLLLYTLFGSLYSTALLTAKAINWYAALFFHPESRDEKDVQEMSISCILTFLSIFLISVFS